MRITISSLLATCLALVISVSTWAQSSKYTGSLLWKVSGKDITEPSYILGTHHLTNIEFLDKINGFEDAFAASKTIVGELDLGNKAQLMQTVQQSVAMAPGEKGYKALLTEEDYKKLNNNLITHLCMPLEPLEGFKPSLISTLLAAKMYSTINPSFNPQGHVAIDEHVQNLAQQQGKAVKGLETADDQIKALFSDPIEEQLEELICSLDEIDKGIDALKQMDSLYQSGNIKSLYELAIENKLESACPMKEDKKNKILDHRNDQWIKQLPQLLKEGSNFIAVGALHLGGEEGLLYQLGEMGYTVEPVK